MILNQKKRFKFILQRKSIYNMKNMKVEYIINLKIEIYFYKENILSYDLS